MGRKSSAQTRGGERDLDRGSRELRALDRKLSLLEADLRRVTARVERQEKRWAVVEAALRLGPRAKPGDTGAIGAINAAVLKLEEYLLKTGERIGTILEALKQHREFLVDLDAKVLRGESKERLKLELDLMRNTLSILALGGFDLDEDLGKEIEAMRAEVTPESDAEELRRRKTDLDRRFAEEMKRFDVGALLTKKKDIAGYG